MSRRHCCSGSCRTRSDANGGVIVFELALFAVVFIVLGRRLRPAAAMTTGLTVLVPAVALVVIVANSVPVIGVGLLSALTGALPASIVFACTLAVLAVAALIWRRRSTATSSTPPRGDG